MESHYLSSRKVPSSYEVRSPTKSSEVFDATRVNNGRGFTENSSPGISYEKSLMMRTSADRTPPSATGQQRLPPRFGHNLANKAAVLTSPVEPGSLLIVDPDDDACSEITESVWMSPRGNMTHHRYQPSATMLAMEEDASCDESALTPKSYKLREETFRQTPQSEQKHSLGNMQQSEPPLVSSYYARRRLQQQQGRQDDVRDETPTRLSRDTDRRLLAEESVGSRRSYRDETATSTSDRNKEQSDAGHFNFEAQRTRAEDPVPAKSFSTIGSNYGYSRGLEESGSSAIRRLRAEEMRYDKESRNIFSHGKERFSPSINDRLEERDTYQGEESSNCRPPRSKTASSSSTIHDNFRERDTSRSDSSPRSALTRNTPTNRDNESSTRSPGTDKMGSLGGRSNFSTSNRSGNASPSTVGISSKDFSSSRENNSFRDNERPDIRSISISHSRNRSFTLQDVSKDQLRDIDVEENGLRRSLDDIREKDSDVKRLENKLREQEWEIKKLSDIRMQIEAKHDSEVKHYQEMLEASLSEKEDLKRHLSDITQRLKECEANEYDTKKVKEEIYKMEEHYQHVIETLEQQLANCKDDAINKKQIYNEKIKDLEDQHQSEKGRYLSIIRDLEDKVSGKDFELTELRSKEKEVEEVLRCKEELIRKCANLEKELSEADKQSFEASELVKEMEVSLRNQRLTIVKYEKEMALMEKDIKELTINAEKQEKEARYHQSKLDECHATIETLQRQADYEKDQRKAVRDHYEAELNQCKGEKKDIVQSYEKDLKESHFKYRVLEDAAAEDKVIIEGLRKQLRKYQMGQL